MEEDANRLAICQHSQVQMDQFRASAGYRPTSDMPTYDGPVTLSSADSTAIHLVAAGSGQRFKIESRKGPLPTFQVGQRMHLVFWSTLISLIRIDSSMVLRDEQGDLILATYNRGIDPDSGVKIDSATPFSVTIRPSCRLDFVCLDRIDSLDIVVEGGQASVVVPPYEKRIVGQSGRRFEVANVFSHWAEGVRAGCSLTDFTPGPHASFSILRL
jgi:hypothetical protein